MAVIIETNDPAGLLKKLKKAIDEKDIATWSYDADGDFTHDPEQWVRKAWLRPTIEQNRLVFGIIKPNGAQMTDLVYGVYHGRFIECVVNHFALSFRTATATANFLDPYDKLGHD